DRVGRCLRYGLRCSAGGVQAKPRDRGRHILVAAARQVDQDQRRLAGLGCPQPRSKCERSGEGVRRLDGRNDPLRTRQQLKGLHRLRVGDWLVMRSTDLGEPGVFWPDSRIVESGRDGMRGPCLSVLVLEYEGTHAMQHPDLPSRDRRGMSTALDALTAGLKTV